jgi:hypothetical protein
MQREGKPSPAYPHAGPATALAGLFLWSGASVNRLACRRSGACQKVSWGRYAAGGPFREADVSVPLCLMPKFYRWLILVRHQDRSIFSPK